MKTREPYKKPHKRGCMMRMKEREGKNKPKILRILYGFGVTIVSSTLVLLYIREYLESKWLIHQSILKMPILAILGIIVVLDILIFVVIDVIRKNIEKVFAQEKEVEAKLISKSSYPYSTQKAMVSNNAGGRSTVNLSHTLTGTRYELYFQLKNGKYLSFFVPKKLYDTMIEGKEGKLQYQGENLIGFSNQKLYDQNGDESKGFVSIADDFKK